MQEERSRHFTLMLMPETSSAEVKRIRVSRRLLVAAVVGFFAIVVLSIGAIGWSAWLYGQAEEASVLRSQNAKLRTEIDDLDARVEKVTSVVDRVAQFETKLRSLTMISDPARNLAMGPVGGADASLVDARRGEAAKLKRDLLVAPQDAAAHADQRLSWVESAADDIHTRTEGLSVLLEGQHAALSGTPSRRPSRGYVTSQYGMRIDPFTGLANLHAGVDFSARLGAPVTATADGVVIFAAKQGAYGKMIEIEHGQGLVTKYAHLQEIRVKVGERVKRGHTIGDVGNTGRSTGPHLHYEIRLNGVPQDPQRFILE